MCYFTIELQEAVRSQASFLEMLENKTPAFIRNFGADSVEVEEHLKTVAEYKIELINLERKLEAQIDSNNGVNSAEPSKLALLVNEAIDSIIALVKNGTIEYTLISIVTHIRDNKYSFNKAHSQVSDILLAHFANVFNNAGKADDKFVVSLCQCTDEDSSELFVLMLADSEHNACLKVLKQYCPNSANNLDNIKIVNNEMYYYDNLSSIEYTLNVISNANK